jgi:outer membrane protein OmpA-like peptidoglycan-associated protein
MINRSLIFCLMASVAPICVAAEQVLVFPQGSVQSYEALDVSSTFQLPVGAYSAGKMNTVSVEGVVTQQVWKTPNSPSDTQGLISPLRDQLQQAGYTVLFECETRVCGGFDFRFNTPVVQEPEMHVDLGNFRYLSAFKTVDEEEDFIGLLVSQSPDRGFIQMTSIGGAPAAVPNIALSTKQPSASTETPENDDLAGRLEHSGAFVLDGLEFLKGSSNLNGNPSSSLQELATFLTANPTKTVVLVGHTDASGLLDGNVTLSRKRADSVMLRLIETYGVDPTQLSAEGVGYLSPRATNATDEGRDKNRRVEVVLTAVE